jgi:hypothetical protein
VRAPDVGSIHKAQTPISDQDAEKALRTLVATPCFRGPRMASKVRPADGAGGAASFFRLARPGANGPIDGRKK